MSYRHVSILSIPIPLPYKQGLVSEFLSVFTCNKVLEDDHRARKTVINSDPISPKLYCTSQRSYHV